MSNPDLTRFLTPGILKRASRWMDALVLYEPSLYAHAVRVGGLAAAFCMQLGYSAEDIDDLTLAGLLHDVGKLEVDRSVLRKTDALTEGEKALMRLHPETGCSMLRTEGQFSEVVLDVALRHHERLDGSGYPDHLQAASISESVRIVTICDIFTAMTEDRPHARPFTWQTALAVMASKSTRIDQHLAKEFAAMIEANVSDEAYSSRVVADCRALVRHI